LGKGAETAAVSDFLSFNISYGNILHNILKGLTLHLPAVRPGATPDLVMGVVQTEFIIIYQPFRLLHEEKRDLSFIYSMLSSLATFQSKELESCP
jgi:hypothetical protein